MRKARVLSSENFIQCVKKLRCIFRHVLSSSEAHSVKSHCYSCGQSKKLCQTYVNYVITESLMCIL